jgi:hypothetical protein
MPSGHVFFAELGLGSTGSIAFGAYGGAGGDFVTSDWRLVSGSIFAGTGICRYMLSALLTGSVAGLGADGIPAALGRDVCFFRAAYANGGRD